MHERPSSGNLDNGDLSGVSAGHERRREQREEAEEHRRGEHVIEPGSEDPPPRDEPEHRVVLGELLEVVARRLPLINHRASRFQRSVTHIGTSEDSR